MYAYAYALLLYPSIPCLYVCRIHVRRNGALYRIRRKLVACDLVRHRYAMCFYCDSLHCGPLTGLTSAGQAE